MIICLQSIDRLVHCIIQEENKLLSINLTTFSNYQQFVKPKKLFLLTPFYFISRKLHLSDWAQATQGREVDYFLPVSPPSEVKWAK